MLSLHSVAKVWTKLGFIHYQFRYPVESYNNI